MANLTRLASSQIREIVLASLGRLVTSGKAPSEPLPDFRVLLWYAQKLLSSLQEKLLK